MNEISSERNEVIAILCFKHKHQFESECYTMLVHAKCVRKWQMHLTITTTTTMASARTGPKWKQMANACVNDVWFRI